MCLSFIKKKKKNNEEKVEEIYPKKQTKQTKT